MMRWLLLVVVACGCSGSNDGADGGDAMADVEASVAYPAPHPPMPQAINSGGGVVASPKLVVVTFQGDPLEASLDAFASQLVSVPEYWKTAVAEYGVGAITQVAYHAADTPPATVTDADVQAWLSSKIQSDPMLPQPDESTIYVLFYPSATSITLGSNASCTGFLGYHDAYALSPTTNVIYGVIARCTPPASISVTDLTTAIASHEIAEAATNPLPKLMPSYASVDSNSRAWEMLAGGELADLCAGLGSDVTYQPAGFDHLANHIWSNAAAAASHDPCQRAGSSPYFNSAPVLPDTIQLAGAVKTMGVKLLAGQSATIELDLYSDAPTSGPWTVSAIDLTSAFFNRPPALTFSLDRNSGQNGDKLNLTITSLRNVVGGAPFWIQNDLGTQRSVWLAAVSPQ